MDDQEEIKTLKQVCLALISHIIATEAALCQLDSKARDKIKNALIESQTENFLKEKGKMLDEVTAQELSQIVMRMPLQLDETLKRLAASLMAAKNR